VAAVAGSETEGDAMIRETDVGRDMASYLETQRWDCFFEATLSPHDREPYGIGKSRPDIAATRGLQLLVVECKLTMSFELFAQAKKWQPLANGVAIAVPAGSLTEGRQEAFDLCRVHYGLGVFERNDDGRIVERVVPRWHTRSSDALLSCLAPEHKTHADPGTSSGGQFTPMKRTAAALAAFVAEHKGCTLSEALDVIPHHYRSRSIAEVELGKAIRRRQTPGAFLGWKQRLWSTAKEAETGGVLS
jgi:hypothetical protein